MTDNIVPTHSILEFSTLMQTRTDRETTSIIVVTGKAGTGKSTAIEYFLAHAVQPAHTCLPVHIPVVAGRGPSAMFNNIFAALGERPRGASVAQKQNSLAESLANNGVQLVICDDADRLNIAALDALLQFQSRTKCQIVLVGLPELPERLQNCTEYHDSRVMVSPFHPPNLDEVLDVILPRLAIPRWYFQPNTPAHRAVGTRIWEHARPSLRRLTQVLQIASLTASAEGLDRITPAVIDEAIGYVCGKNR